jgi:HD-GYP domain-containing protein (c-di-GMP phosphodiesterase class II)
VFDALLSRRPYKEPWPFDEALAEIEAGSGTHFDPRLTPVFLAMIRRESTIAAGVENGLALPRSLDVEELGAIDPEQLLMS